MALLFMDGFDAGDAGLKWRLGGAAPTSVVGGRYGTGRYVSLNSGIYFDLTSPATKVFVGASLGCNTVDATIRPFVSFYSDSGATTHLTIGIANNSIQLRRGGAAGTLLASYANTFLPNTFYNIEVSATIDDAVGVCEVRYNGITVINYSGDTRNAGTSNLIDSVAFGPNGGVNPILDDVYIADDTGPAPHNTFLGEIRVQTLVPNAAGSSTQFTPSSGANYTTVDELPYSAADFVASSTVGHKDMYAFSNLSTTGTVYAIQNNVIAKKTDASALSLRPVLSSGATSVQGATTALNSSDRVLRDLRALNPDTSAAWDQTSVNALEAGFEVM